jgi:hypothetical protein
MRRQPNHRLSSKSEKIKYIVSPVLLFSITILINEHPPKQKKREHTISPVLSTIHSHIQPPNAPQFGKKRIYSIRKYVRVTASIVCFASLRKPDFLKKIASEYFARPLIITLFPTNFVLKIYYPSSRLFSYQPLLSSKHIALFANHFRPQSISPVLLFTLHSQPLPSLKYIARPFIYVRLLHLSRPPKRRKENITISPVLILSPYFQPFPSSKYIARPLVYFLTNRFCPQSISPYLPTTFVLKVYRPSSRSHPIASHIRPQICFARILSYRALVRR